MHKAKRSGRLFSAPSLVKWTRGCLLQGPGSFPVLVILSNFLNFHWTRLRWVFLLFFFFPSCPLAPASGCCVLLNGSRPNACRGCASVPNKKRTKVVPFPPSL